MVDRTRQEFLDELCPRIRPLFEAVMACDCGCEVVDFFRQYRLTWIEARDIAGQLQRQLDEVTQSLDRLVAIGVVERRVILDWTLYGLPRDPNTLRALEQFWLVRDVWRQQSEDIREALRLRAGRPFGLPADAPTGAVGGQALPLQ